MSDTSTTPQKLAAELAGTFLLVFVGTTTAVLTGADIVATALAFGLALLVGVYAFGRISGAHFNPAVSVGAAISGRMSWAQVPAYAGAQVVGGVVASFLLWVLLKAYSQPVVPDGAMGQNAFGDPGFAWWGALVIEVVATAVLVTVILAVTDARNDTASTAPMVIGLTLAAIHLAVIPMTGTSVNPARSIGPALFSGVDAIKDLWLFILAPLVGGAAAGLGYPALFGRASEPVPGSGLALGRPVQKVTVSTAPDQFQQEWNQQDYPQDQHADPYAAQQAGDQGAHAAQVAQQAYEPEPIIQDGWQWDHQAQEWKPLEHWTDPAATTAAAAAADPQPTVASEPVQPDPQQASPSAPQAGGDPLNDPLESDTAAQQRTEPPWDGDAEQTQIRPRQP